MTVQVSELNLYKLAELLGPDERQLAGVLVLALTGVEKDDCNCLVRLATVADRLVSEDGQTNPERVACLAAAEAALGTEFGEAVRKRVRVTPFDESVVQVHEAFQGRCGCSCSAA